ncbi:hypothetical protein BDR05DRAFT_946805 [Suillus weaverae]|nr:hypothetical protein BDR05DRAFT_946805 [Suillus weaverae]
MSSALTLVLFPVIPLIQAENKRTSGSGSLSGSACLIRHLKPFANVPVKYIAKCGLECRNLDITKLDGMEVASCVRANGGNRKLLSGGANVDTSTSINRSIVYEKPE